MSLKEGALTLKVCDIGNYNYLNLTQQGFGLNEEQSLTILFLNKNNLMDDCCDCLIRMKNELM